MSDASLMLATDERGVTTLTLNRPDRHNALDRACIDSLTQALAGLGSDTRVLVLTGAGKNFCASADPGWMKAPIPLSEAENTADAEALSTLLATLNSLPVPTLARVHGAAMGGGAGLVNALLQRGPAAQASARSLIDEVHGKCADKPLQRELSERLATIHTGAEAQEGLVAFTERRKPAWRPG